jgi:hypothetical protein
MSTHFVEPRPYPYYSEKVKCSPGESHSFLENPLIHWYTALSLPLISSHENISSDIQRKTNKLHFMKKPITLKYTRPLIRNFVSIQILVRIMPENISRVVV